MDNITVYLIIGAVIAAIVIFLVLRKPSSAEEEEEPEPRKPSRQDAPKKLAEASPLDKTLPGKAKDKGPASLRGEPAPEPAKAKAAKPAEPEEEPEEEEEEEEAADDEVDEAAADEKQAAEEAEEEAEDEEAAQDQAGSADEEEEEQEEEEEEEDFAPAKPPPPPPKRKPDVKGLRKGLAKVRKSGGLFGRLKELFVGKKELDPSIVEDIEQILLTSDVGVQTTEMLIAELRAGLESRELDDTDRVWQALRERAHEILKIGGGAIRNYGQPTVVLVVGVNGTGKTTTIAKIARQQLKQKKKVMLVAADTFRAAAVKQLQIWATRIKCDVFCGEPEADPAAVVFDAIKKGIEDETDVILVDTAGRLHTKANLMDELKKVARTSAKALKGSPHETLLVVDATTGQNAVQQAGMFKEALPLTGIVLTKLDGTAKGGVVMAIAAEHELPVRYVGTGEKARDLRDFDAEEFVEAMLGQDDGAVRAA